MKLVAEKRAKGYREIKAAKPAKPTPERANADELVVRELRNGGGRAGRMIIDGKRVLVTGETCLVSSNGERFPAAARPANRGASTRKAMRSTASRMTSR